MKWMAVLFLILPAVVFARENSQWVELCQRERSILVKMPTADQNAIADHVSWLGKDNRSIRIEEEDIDLRSFSEKLSKTGSYSSVISLKKGGKLYIEVDSENIENIFNYLVENPGEDQLFSYLSDIEIEHLGNDLNMQGATSVYFSLLASQIEASSIACIESSRSDDIRKMSLLIFKGIPLNYEVYKVFVSDGIVGVITGFKLGDKNLFEVLYEIDGKIILKMIYEASDQEKSLEDIYQVFLGAD